jgi:phosphohistidine phosphatase
MHVFLVRHAHAVSGDPDELRALSDRGREEARDVARRLAEHPTPPAVVLTSPLLRARQTAEEIARASGAELRVDERLAPGATAELLRDALVGVGGAVAVVGHQPDCSEIALELTGDDPSFPTAGVLELDLGDQPPA